MLRAEEAIKKKLNIKYVGAQRLIAEAKQNLSIAPGDTAAEDERFDEIVDEAANIFQDDLTEQEQKEMRVSDVKPESDFVRKAREAAEKRERQWALDEEERQRLANGGSVATATAAGGDDAAALPEQAKEGVTTIIQDDDKAYITETTTTTADGKTRTVRTVRTVKPVKVPKGATSAGVTCACTIL